MRQVVVPRVPANVNVLIREQSGAWSPPARRAASLAGNNEFDFLNRRATVRSAADWQNPNQPRLWLYNLHYFDDLNAKGAQRRIQQHRDLVAKWIAENLAAQGVGWEAYPTSLRIVNWIKWSLSGSESGTKFHSSLALQAAWLRKNLEWHLLGNHLFSNAKALVFAGAFFDDDAAKEWLQTGLEIVQSQIAEQVLHDGGHFERSPMYHQLALEDILDLINIGQAYPAVIDAAVVLQWKKTASSMLSWSQKMRHPDGDIVLFNDSAFGIAPDPAELDLYAGRLAVTAPQSDTNLTYFDDSGYVVAESGPAVLFADIAVVGPDYLPGHAHADTLTFELSAFGERWIVDTGCSVYDVGDERLRQRGTDAHNTVSVDGQNSSEVWSSFRVARRARPFDVSVKQGTGGIEVAASHDGYQRLPGKVSHRRLFHLTEDGLQISDRLSGHFASARAGFLLHPDVDVTKQDGQMVLSRSGNAIEFQCEGGCAEIEQASWNPQFGIDQPTRRIVIDMNGPDLSSRFTWQSVVT